MNQNGRCYGVSPEKSKKGEIRAQCSAKVALNFDRHGQQTVNERHTLQSSPFPRSSSNFQQRSLL